MKQAVPFHKRLYVWSVIFEPLLFFVLFEQAATGVTGNLSRILQFVVVIVLIARALIISSGPKAVTLKIPRVSRPLYRYFFIYFLLAVVAGVIGYLSGAYSLPGAYNPPTVQSAFAAALNSPAVRPVFEYVVALYYFIYFTVVARYLLTTPADINYALSRFKMMFIVSFVVGVIDTVLSSVGILQVPRHISDWRRVDPGRFHGLAGEPRQAIVYLFLGLAILHLEAYFRGRSISKWWIVLIVMAALLTQSASGLIGIVLFAGLYGLYATWTISPWRLVQVAIVCIASVALVYATAINSKRVMDYVKAASGLWQVLESGEELPELMSKANSDIYPLYDLTRKVRSLDFVPVVIGSGFGSASAVTNRYFLTGAMTNPHSELARSLYESGILGTFVFVMAFVHPVRTSTKYLPKSKQREFMLVMMLLLGGFFGHRSSAPFIYLGMFAAMFRVSEVRGRHACPGDGRGSSFFTTASSDVSARATQRRGPAARRRVAATPSVHQR
jgi:hypothetical protein